MTSTSTAARLPLERPVDAPAVPRDSLYLRCLEWVFLGFSSTRILAYLPTMMTIWEQHNSDQHSLVTWVVWAGANASMAAWLYEQHGRKLDRSIVVSMGNSVMSLATALLILSFR